MDHASHHLQENPNGSVSKKKRLLIINLAEAVNAL